MTHDFYFNSSTVVDVYQGQQEYDWMAWFYNPGRKPFYITENQKNTVQFGTPIFKFGRSLALRRFFPSDELNGFAIEFYEQSKKNYNLTLLDFKEKYVKTCNKYFVEHPSSGRYETDEEMIERYRYELFESKRVLENKLNKKVEFLCWPGGGYNETSIQISEAAGYKASTLASYENVLNFDNSAYFKRISRFGLSSSIRTKKHIYDFPYNAALVHSFKTYENKWLYKFPLKFFSYLYKLHDKFL